MEINDFLGTYIDKVGKTINVTLTVSKWHDIQVEHIHPTASRDTYYYFYKSEEEELKNHLKKYKAVKEVSKKINQSDAVKIILGL